MAVEVQEIVPRESLALRTRYLEAAGCQVVHDSLYRREGWTRCYRFSSEGREAGFGSVAVGGPWKDKPTIYEFYLLPEFEGGAFAWFEAFLSTSEARYFEVQTSDALLAVMLHTFGRDVVTEKIVFRDGSRSQLAANGASVRLVTPMAEVMANVERRQGGGEWVLEVEGRLAGRGGLLFHYNRPYGDVYMEVDEAFRRQGRGAFLVQELKRACYGLGAVPAARCNPSNTASRATLQRAGFVPYALILNATVV